jgi:hypothetical protein
MKIETTDGMVEMETEDMLDFNFEEYSDKISVLKGIETKVQELTKQATAIIFKEFFKNHSNVFSEIKWKQGYSVYNDNTYDYYEHPDYLYFKFSENPEIQEFLKLKDIDDKTLEIDCWHADPDIAELLKSLESSVYNDTVKLLVKFNVLHTKSLIEVFGSNAIVRVSKDKIEVDEVYD